MACKPHHKETAKRLHDTVDKVDRSVTKPDESYEIHYKVWMYKVIPMTHGYWEKKIIDLGCDNGGTFASVKRGNITHVDFVDRDVPNFTKADLEEELPFTDNMFDVSVIAEVLEHVQDPEFSLSEAIRISNDKIVVSVPHEFSWSKGCDPFKHGEHIHYFTYDSFRELIDNTGLRNDGIIYTFLTNGTTDFMAWMGSVLYKDVK